jgi:hypothetical protein
MKLKYLFGILICFLIAENAAAQATETFTWWNPAANAFPVLEGQAWPGKVKNFYDRLPAKAEQTVRKEVWDLSHHSAGLYITFKTNAGSIVVRYGVASKGNFAMPHMPATGVSGVDLYAIDHSGNWVWAPGKYTFSDTITYQFSNIEVDQQSKGRDGEFRLFLPLYNAVSWMEIGVPEGNTFTAMPLSEEKPVVIYGTSIAQGGCASRPGMAWTAILERQLDYPLINLGFSGNGRLEKPVIDLMTEIDAKIYVLDCLPNLVNIPDKELENRIRESVSGLRAKRPSTPILLVEHSLGSHSGIVNAKRVEDCERSTKVLQQTFVKLQGEGVKNIYILSTAALGMDINSTVDGSHPTDLGMKQHADAYAKIIREIVHEPVNLAYSTTQPIIQSRDGYDWRGRHNAIIELNKKSPPRNVIIANSIIHYWAGEPKDPIARGEDSWNRYLAPLDLRNMAFGWDRIENALWRVYHGTLDGYNAKHVVVMIGTNNLVINGNEEIIAGLKLLMEAIQFRQPGTSILLSGIFPRRDMEKRVAEINKEITKLAAAMNVTYINPGRVFLNTAGKIDESLFSDGLHPNVAGYNKLAPVLAAYLKK